MTNNVREVDMQIKAWLLLDGIIIIYGFIAVIISFPKFYDPESSLGETLRKVYLIM